jgi:PKHD-type hydroxylase
MIFETQNILTQAEIDRLREIAGQIEFVDGRASNPDNVTKVNLQADPKSPLYTESSNIVMAALVRSREFRDFAFPKRVAPPMLAKYRPGMKYGVHADSAFVAAAPGQSLRADVSATIFISDPKSYEGGELVSYVGGRSLHFKGEPGSIVVYPSTTLHEVAPVASGERLVAITFIQSHVSDEAKRTTLHELNEVLALEGLNMKWQNRVRLEAVSNNLMRQWSSE